LYGINNMVNHPKSFFIRSILGLLTRPDDGGSKHLCNIRRLLQYYTAQHPRRQSSSSTLTLTMVSRLEPLAHPVCLHVGYVDNEINMSRRL
jgi:hypothetical protein